MPAPTSLLDCVILERSVTDGFSAFPTMQEVEAEKQKNLKGESKSSMEKHAPGWNEKLASDSEQKVKALKDERCKGATC